MAVGAALSIVIFLAVVALVRMPLLLLPEIHYPQVRVIADLPGQTSGVIEESVNEPIEAALFGVLGIVRMESRSGDGRSYIDLFFAPGYDLDRGLQDVTQAVQRAQGQIPAGIPEPRIFAVATNQEPVMHLAFGSPTLTPDQIRRRLRSNLLPRLREIPGVQAVHMGREEVPELVAEVDPHRMEAVGVSLDAIEAVLLQATAAPVSGAIRSAGFEGVVVLEGNIWDPARLMERPVPAADGATTVPLGEVVALHRAPSEDRLRVRLDGRPAVLVSVQRSPQAHSLRMASAVRDAMDEVLASSAMGDIEGSLVFDDSRVTRSAVISVITAAVGGAILAILLLLLTLRNRRHTPLVALLVGSSLAATIIVLTAMGQSLNLLTLAGLLLSVGLGLDYAIIYFDRLDRIGPTVKDAHLQAMRDVFGPLLGALLTTVAAVLPFLLVQGAVALLFRPLIWTVVIAAIASFAIAVLVLPVFARVHGSNEASQGKAVLQLQPREPWFRPRHPLVSWGLLAGVAIVLVIGGRALAFEVLPVVDDGFVTVRLAHPAGVTIDEMDRATREAEGALATLPGTSAIFTTVGGYFREGLPAFRPGTADFMVRVDAEEAGDSRAWAAEARQALGGLGVPGLRASVTPPQIRGVRTRLSDADLVVVLTRDDGDLLALGEVESEVLERLRSVRGLVDVQRMRGGVSPRWLAEPRVEFLAAHGIAPTDLERTVAYALEGKVLRQRMSGGEPLALRARFDRRWSGDPGGLQEARVPTGNGSSVALQDLANFRLVEEPTHIERRDGQRVVRVAGQLDPAGPGATAVGRAVREALAEADLPEGIGWWLEGELDAVRETSRTFGIALLLALTIVFALLVIQYGSLALALSGLLVIPLSGAGAIVLLALLSRPLDAMVLAGLLIAVGIVANNVILVLSEAQHAARREAGTSLSDGLRRAARDRFRPITLTVLSTVIGMSPLLLGGAEVFGLLQPLAIALTGTLILSIPMACFVLPGVAASLARDQPPPSSVSEARVADEGASLT